MDKSKKLIIVIILLVVIIGGVSFYAFHQAKENKEMSELFAVEKLEMENEYTTFATQYDELQIQINNDSLREKLDSIWRFLTMPVILTAPNTPVVPLLELIGIL
jgi:Tfp pilus assembly protein PilO